MADVFNLQTLVTQLQNVVLGINALTAQMKASTSSIFPQTQGTSTTATGGAITPPAQIIGYIDVTLPNGSTAKVPYYAT